MLGRNAGRGEGLRGEVRGREVSSRSRSRIVKGKGMRLIGLMESGKGSVRVT